MLHSCLKLNSQNTFSINTFSPNAVSEQSVSNDAVLSVALRVLGKAEKEGKVLGREEKVKAKADTENITRLTPQVFGQRIAEILLLMRV